MVSFSKSKATNLERGIIILKPTNVPFSQLSIECKSALMEYHYMQGFTDVKELEEWYKGRTFSIEVITIEEAKQRCMNHMSEWSGYQGMSFEQYHTEYVGAGSDIPNYGNSVWPLIVPGDEEWLADGWHRFHSYVKYQIREVPLLSIQ